MNDKSSPRILDLSKNSLSIAELQLLVNAINENDYIDEVNLSECGLGDKGAEIVSQLNMISKLTISHNKIGVVGASFIATMTTITFLDISHNDIENAGFSLIIDTNKSIASFNASGNHITCEGLDKFDNNTSLSEIFLAENLIDDSGAILISSAMNLTVVDLTSNIVGNAGAMALAAHPKLQKLLLGENNLTDACALSLAINDTIIYLNVSNNRLCMIGAKILSANQKLAYLNISDNHVNDYGVFYLLKNMKNLVELVAQYNQVGDTAFTLLDEVETISIQRLDLSYNQTTHVSMSVLLKFPQLEALNLSCNMLGDLGAEVLSYTTTIRLLNISSNHITSNGILNYERNSSIDKLILTYNLIDDLGAKALSKNDVLRHVYLSYNDISDDGLSYFINTSNSNLIVLYLNFNKISNKGRLALGTLNSRFEKVEAREAPEYSDNNLKNTFLLSQDFTCVRSIDGLIQFFNPAFSRVLGYTHDELLAHSFYSFLHPDDYDKEVKINSGHKFPISAHESRFRTKAGTYRTIRWSSQIRKDCVYATGTDITTNKQIEEQLNIKNLKLENQAVKVKAAELSTKLQTAMMSYLCHELRNPLSGIYGNVGLAQRNINTIERLYKAVNISDIERETQLLETFTALNDNFEAIRDCVEYQRKILDANLNLARINANKIIMEEVVFDLKESILEVERMCKSNAMAKGIALKIILPSYPLIVKGDNMCIKQIVSNLIGNAIKFTLVGMIKCEVVRLEENENDSTYQIMISDTGIGMTPEESSGVFHRFIQANASVSGEYGGSGLGLQISKKIAMLMKGDITVTSEENVGSVFVCKFTCLNPSPAELLEFNQNAIKKNLPLASMKLFPPCSDKRNKILIADDNTINRKLLGNILRNEGFQLFFANDGNEAIEQFEKHAPSLILMDLIMPNLDGLAAMRIIREKEAGSKSHTPIIAITGNALEQDREVALSAGMDEYIIKPFSSAKLIETINLLINSDKSKTVEKSAQCKA